MSSNLKKAAKRAQVNNEILAKRGKDSYNMSFSSAVILVFGGLKKQYVSFGNGVTRGSSGRVSADVGYHSYWLEICYL